MMRKQLKRRITTTRKQIKKKNKEFVKIRKKEFVKKDKKEDGERENHLMLQILGKIV